jgi:hypothetical protein
MMNNKMMKRQGLGLHLGKGYKNLIQIDPYIHSMSARGITQKLLVTPLSKDVIYHKGLFQNKWDAKHPKQLSKDKALKEYNDVDKIKKEIAYLLFQVRRFRGEQAKDHELLTITTLKDKAHHFDFLTSHTDFPTTGYFKDDILDTRFEKEKNVSIQIEFLDTKHEKIGKRLEQLFEKLNSTEVGESLLYVRTEAIEESSLPLEKWR